MRRFAHVLRKNKLANMPTKVVIVDTETYEEVVNETRKKHYLKLGWAVYLERKQGGKVYSEEWFYFTRVEQFWDWFLSKCTKKSKTYLISHQQHFDFAVLQGFSQLTKRGWKLNRNILTSNLFIAKFVYPLERLNNACVLETVKDKNGKVISEKSIEVLDSLNWFKMSIKQMGEVIGLEKGVIDFNTCSIKELSDYCKRDVEILKETFLNWLSFLQKYNLGNFKPTAASQAFTAYCHRFMNDKIYIHDNISALGLERESYKGGRCEAFIIGEAEGRIYNLDFNSLYPFVMREKLFPTKLVKYLLKGSVIGLKHYLKKHAVIARVKIKVEEPAIGVKEQRLIFPTGTFWATLTTPELKYVLEHGEILEVGEMSIYEQSNIFKDWVDELYSMRVEFKSENNTVYDMLTKLLLNSLYGKFGQKTDKIEEYGECGLDECFVESGHDMDIGENFIRWAFGGKIYIKWGKSKEWWNSSPAIAAHVTAEARFVLWEAIKRAGRENVYYCDTDSLFVNEKGYNNLKNELNEKGLGKLKIEQEGENLMILGLKDYVFDKKVKIKGIRKDAKLLTTNKYEQDRFLKFKSLLRENSLDAPIVDIITKNLKREYLKGKVGSSGKVTPFNFPEDKHLLVKPKKKRKGRELPRKADIIEKATEMFMRDNWQICTNNPELSELREGGYIKEAQLELMRNPVIREYEE